MYQAAGGSMEESSGPLGSGMRFNTIDKTHHHGHHGHHHDHDHDRSKHHQHHHHHHHHPNHHNHHDHHHEQHESGASDVMDQVRGGGGRHLLARTRASLGAGSDDTTTSDGGDGAEGAGGTDNSGGGGGGGNGGAVSKTKARGFELTALLKHGGGYAEDSKAKARAYAGRMSKSGMAMKDDLFLKLDGIAKLLKTLQVGLVVAKETKDVVVEVLIMAYPEGPIQDALRALGSAVDAMVGFVQLVFDLGASLSTADLCGAAAAIGKLGGAQRAKVKKAFKDVGVALGAEYQSTITEAIGDDDEEEGTDGEGGTKGGKKGKGKGGGGGGGPVKAVSRFRAMFVVMKQLVTKFDVKEMFLKIRDYVQSPVFSTHLSDTKQKNKLAKLCEWFGLPNINAGANVPEQAGKVQEKLVAVIKHMDGVWKGAGTERRKRGGGQSLCKYTFVVGVL